MILAIERNESGNHWFAGWSDGLIDSKTGYSYEYTYTHVNCYEPYRVKRMYFSANTVDECISLAEEYCGNMKVSLSRCSFRQAVKNAKLFL